MQRNDEEIQKRQNQMKREIDDYELTIQGLLAFCHESRWNDKERRILSDSQFSIGRRMNTSPDNRIQPNTTVTPDLIMQLTTRYGIVAEAKIKFPQDRNWWYDDFKQLEKYDDNLTGWFTDNELIGSTDIVLLTQMRMKNQVCDFIQEQIANKKIHFERPFAVVGFIREARDQEAIYLEKGCGEISNPDLDLRLHNGRSIHLETLTIEYNIKFYDTSPPLAYTMSILWSDVFPNLITIDSYMKERTKRSFTIQVSVDQLVNQLREQSSIKTGAHRVPAIPKTEWIRNALDAFVRFGFGDHMADNEYSITYRKIKKPLDEFIYRLCREQIEQEGKSSKRSRQNPQGKESQLSFL